MSLPDRTKSGFRGISYPGNPNIDARWGDIQLNSEAIQCVGNQYAGPNATFIEQDEATTGAVHQGHDPIPPKLKRSRKHE